MAALDDALEQCTSLRLSMHPSDRVRHAVTRGREDALVLRRCKDMLSAALSSESLHELRSSLGFAEAHGLNASNLAKQVEVKLGEVSMLHEEAKAAVSNVDPAAARALQD